MDLNGHSSAVTMRYYVHRNRQNQVTAVNNAFPRYNPIANVYEGNAAADEPVLNAPVVSTPPAVRSHTAPQYTPVQPTSALDHEDWGVDHPQFGKVGRVMRFNWTAAELGWLRTWRSSNPYLSASQCLRAIGESAEARRIFHRNHIQTSTRLDNGFKILNREEV